ncbi:enoyl-[acyl-carrier-protein] reductase (NADH) [Candidatus Blochmanniella pennsylvanica str. BPEN]|uniref:Enoyl-[acyl-carrier-protein] reductase [NADH] n=1 Tax=Blochmanniella pennsylvanica (strain BPEN) TaxID=291272 RepID=Q492P0_BLOPB|nr:SDR family oxidoreductase [Candidatus Blochmannia pennsylvanicus]AAZ41055.1 enoyl-[acyl-carrier-protein] reductase (NADH) [Candidatus Blochmannia pennsylvanicus str. BPEN]UOY04262.1 SDR family oxidoreductase [Candidatus Blochmannia pennsylvanicus]
MALLSNKRILVTGVANNKSIAYGIAQALHREGAELAFTYHTDKLKLRVQNLSKNFDSNIVLPCDVSEDSYIDKLFVELRKKWSTFDGFIHAIAFAPTDQLKGDYVDTVTREGFTLSHVISSYSFVGIAKACEKMLNNSASLVTLTYLGAMRATPYYNVMGLAKASLEANTRYMANTMGPKKGIRVNAISCGPVRTLASSGIKNFKKMLLCYQRQSPMRRNISIDEIGNVAVFLCSDLSSGITGEIIYVDGGFNIASNIDDVE